MGKPAVIDEPRSPEREALAEAIARYQRAEERVNRSEEVSEGLIVGPMADKVEQAERNLALAKKCEPQRTVAELLGDHVPGPSVEEAEADLAEARADLVRAERVREAVNIERREAHSERQLAKHHVDSAIQNVVRAESADKLLARFEAAKMEVERQREVLTFLSGSLPPNWDSLRYYPNSGASIPWRAAYLELAESPDAELPE